MNTNPTQKNSSISWWMYLLNGVLLIVLGIWMLKTPRDSFNAMMLIAGLIILLSGLAEVFISIYYRKILWEWGWSLAAGMVDIVIGIFLIANPGAILVIITFFISFWLVVKGVTTVRESLQLQKLGSRNWKWILSLGILLLLLAVILIWHPQIVGLTLMIWLAISFVSLGIFRVVLAFKIQNLSKSD